MKKLKKTQNTLQIVKYWKITVFLVIGNIRASH